VQASEYFVVTPEYEPRWEVSENKALKSDDVEEITGYTELSLLYKNEVDGGAEEGSYADDYSTTFTPEYDPSGGTIVFDGEHFIDSETTILQVKDGNNDPSVYLFDISGWDGQQSIQLKDFWPEQGAISYVAIHGSEKVPEPTTIASLASLGVCFGLHRARRRRRKQHV
jgi:hypothetical protein